MSMNGSEQSSSTEESRINNLSDAGDRRRTMWRYVLPVEQTEWKFDGHTDVTFTWEYDDNRAGLLQLYSKGKQQQWDAAERIDWSQDLDPENPMQLDDRVIMIYGSDIWNRMTGKKRRQ